jgi:hypothetical protein
MIGSLCLDASTYFPILGKLTPQRDSSEAMEGPSSSTGLSWSLGDSKVGEFITIPAVKSILGGLSEILDANFENGGALEILEGLLSLLIFLPDC